MMDYSLDVFDEEVGRVWAMVEFGKRVGRTRKDCRCRVDPLEGHCGSCEM